MTTRRIRLAIFLFPLALCLSPTVSAQGTSATLRGTVRSQSGGAVSEASVSAKNLATGETRTARSGEAGQFAIPGLPPGVYQLEVAREGFASQKRGAVEFDGMEPRLVEFVLEPRSGADGGTPVTRIGEAQLAGLTEMLQPSTEFAITCKLQKSMDGRKSTIMQGYLTSGAEPTIRLSWELSETGVQFSSLSEN